MSQDLPSLRVILASPRGFCAGVDRAIKIVEKAIEKYGPPVYVRHEIVHNRFVVESLETLGAIFVDELSEIPDGYPVIFSAHGVPKSVPEAARMRELFYVDATCPLVSKVHREVEHHFEAGCKIVLIGHAGHVEVIGTMGQLPEGAVMLVENVRDVENLDIAFDQPLAYATQTTLSVDETKDIVKALEEKFPHIIGPRKEDICFATTNRQMAVKRIAEESDAIIVIGAPNSSNSQRLVETALSHGCGRAKLFQRASEIDWEWMRNVKRLGISAGASAPEELVDEVIAACQERFIVEIEEVKVIEENVAFNIPRILRSADS